MADPAISSDQVLRVEAAAHDVRYLLSFPVFSLPVLNNSQTLWRLNAERDGVIEIGPFDHDRGLIGSARY